MKRTIALLACVLAIGSAYAQTSDEAKDVLRRSREKCQSIKQGHYVIEWKEKFMSRSDTVFVRYTCDFKKLPNDTVFTKTFAQYEDYGDNNQHYLYTGKEFVRYNDSVGSIMTCEKWADRIISIRHNYTFYDALTEQSSYPLPDEEHLADSSYSYSLSDVELDGRPCYLARYRKTDFDPDTIFGINTLLYEVSIWIDKRNYLPIQYTVFFVNEENRDTMTQFEEYRLLEFSPKVDKRKLTMKSVPASVKLKDYEPYKAPEPLAEGTPAPDWSLPTLTGDTIRLADLRGKVVLLDFFYKSCAPCCAALPFLQTLHKKYNDKGFVMLGIDPFDVPEKDEMADFLAKRDITYTVLFSDRELPSIYHVSLYPTLFFIDRDGKIAKVRRGYHSSLEAAIEEQLLKMLE